MEAAAPAREEFVAFVREVEPRLRIAVVAAYGPDPGLDAVQEALIWSWEHWERVTRIANPVGYLYRIAMRRASRVARRRQVFMFQSGEPSIPWVEPGLLPALRAMSPMQRQVVVLVAAYGYTQQEVADILGVRRTTAQQHLQRGLTRLRAALAVTDDV